MNKTHRFITLELFLSAAQGRLEQARAGTEKAWDECVTLSQIVSVHKRKRKPKANSMAKTDTQTDLQYTLHALKGTSYSRSSLQKRKPMIRNYAFTI